MVSGIEGRREGGRGTNNTATTAKRPKKNGQLIGSKICSKRREEYKGGQATEEKRRRLSLKRGFWKKKGWFCVHVFLQGNNV